MTPDHLKCPRCKSIFDKPVQYQVLGEMREGYNVLVGDADGDVLPCPTCRYGLPKEEIIKGKFDTIFSSDFHRTEVKISAVLCLVIIVVLWYFVSR
jgi:uncharacterized C2H2 Zn-finger protein